MQNQTKPARGVLGVRDLELVDDVVPAVAALYGRGLDSERRGDRPACREDHKNLRDLVRAEDALSR